MKAAYRANNRKVKSRFPRVGKNLLWKMANFPLGSNVNFASCLTASDRMQTRSFNLKWGREMGRIAAGVAYNNVVSANRSLHFAGERPL